MHSFNRTKKFTKRTMAALLVMLMLVALMPLFSASAAVEVPDKTTITIHDLAFTEDKMPIIHGDGTLIEAADLPNSTPVRDSQYVIIPILEYSDLSDSPSLDEAKVYYGKNITRVVSTVTTDGNGLGTSGQLEKGRYLIYQSVTPESTLTAAPIVLSLPLMNPSGKEWITNAHIYIKNTSYFGAAQLYKTDGATKTMLPGATFSLYSIAKNQEDKLVQSQLVTGTDGYTPIVGNLTAGEYYFVETSAPFSYLINTTKYKFTVAPENKAYGSDGKLITDKVIVVGSNPEKPVPNYKDPIIDKGLIGDMTADIGELNEWQISVDIPGDISKYSEFVITDALDPRLDLVGEITVTTDDNVDGALDSKAYQLSPPGSETISLSLVTGGFNGTQYLPSKAKKLLINITTKINDTAVPGEEIPNSANLKYNNSYFESSKDSIHTPVVVTGGRTFQKTDPKYNPLKGADFVIYKIEDRQKFYVVQDVADKQIKWKRGEEEHGGRYKNATVFSSDDKGNFEIVGLGYGTYYIEEIKAPTGYNLLTQDISFVIDKESYKSEHLIRVINTNAPMIPVTGGMGTIIFFAGGLLAIGGGVLLLVLKKKKEEKEEVKAKN